MAVTIKVGNLFDEQAHWVVGFTDTFDTDTTDNLVINRESLQGQLLAGEYKDDVGRLDKELAEAVGNSSPVATEQRASKPQGKLARYPIGTVATLRTPARYIFAVAYSRMGNNLVARSTVHDLWLALGNLWDAVFTHGQLEPVAVPLIGTKLARVDCLDRESLLKMLLLSFVARSREQLVSRELRVVIHPRDRDKINMLELEAFLPRSRRRQVTVLFVLSVDVMINSVAMPSMPEQPRGQQDKPGWDHRWWCGSSWAEGEQGRLTAGPASLAPAWRPTRRAALWEHVFGPGWSGRRQQDRKAP